MIDPQLLISAQELAEHLNDAQVVIVDCRFSLADPDLGYQQYQTSHIPGAFYLHLNQDLASPVELHGGRHPLPHPQDLAQKLAQIGVNSPETLVVAYDDSRFAFAARLWWLLGYLGHDRVALLDGGFSGWEKAGYPLSREVSKPQQLGKFSPQIRPDGIVDIDTLKIRKDLPEVVLVDSREPGRYRGEHEPIDPIAGHIPGAVNYPWQEVTDEFGKLRSPEIQRQRWANLAQAQEIIVYCGSGVTACVNLFSLAVAGIKTGKLYPGSWSDWCSYLNP